jgi:hypothetical protein
MGCVVQFYQADMWQELVLDLELGVGKSGYGGCAHLTFPTFKSSNKVLKMQYPGVKWFLVQS